MASAQTVPIFSVDNVKVINSMKKQGHTCNYTRSGYVQVYSDKGDGSLPVEFDRIRVMHEGV